MVLRLGGSRRDGRVRVTESAAGRRGTSGAVRPAGTVPGPSARQRRPGVTVSRSSPVTPSPDAGHSRQSAGSTGRLAAPAGHVGQTAAERQLCSGPQLGGSTPQPADVAPAEVMHRLRWSR